MYPAADLDVVTKREAPEPVEDQITEVASDFADCKSICNTFVVSAL
jgi:hypothetical protein